MCIKYNEKWQYCHGYIWSHLILASQRQTHKCKYRREYRREKLRRVQEEKIFFFLYIKRLTIRILLSYTFDIPSIIIISYRIKNKKQFIFFLRASIISILLSNIANFHHLAFNVISFNSYLVLFNRAKSNLTLTWNWNSMKKKIYPKYLAVRLFEHFTWKQ